MEINMVAQPYAARYIKVLKYILYCIIRNKKQKIFVYLKQELVKKSDYSRFLTIQDFCSDKLRA